MAETTTPKRLSKVAKELNVATTTIRNFLDNKGFDVGNNPNAKIPGEAYEQLLQEFQPDKLTKEETEKVVLPGGKSKEEAEKEKPESKSETDQETKPEAKEENQEEVSKEEPTKNEENQEEQPVAEKENQEELTEDKSETATEEEKTSGVKVVRKVDLEDIKSKKGKTKQKEEESKQETEPQEPAQKEPEEATEPIKSEIQEEQAETTEPATPADENQTEEATETTEEAEKTEEPGQAEQASEEEKEKPQEQEQSQQEEDKESPYRASKPKMEGPKVVGNIELGGIKSNRPDKKKPVASTSDPNSTVKGKKPRKRRRIKESDQEKQKTDQEAKSTEKPKTKEKPQRKKKTKTEKPQIEEKEVQSQINETLKKLDKKQGGGTRSKIRKKKRDEAKQKEEERQREIEEQYKNTIEVTEYITVNELASIMDAEVTEIITTCMNLGLMVTMNQRIDAETITVVADEYGYEVDFKEADMDEPSLEEEDNSENYIPRAPIVTIMGHVDHGKTSLLDFIRSSKIIAGESGGITQHIGAYEVELGDDKRSITFLDTPGHEAFTAMRARGAQVTDVAIIIIAADDNVMPQTKEAISHAQAAGVPIIFAINKVDKPNSSPEKVKQELADMDLLVEDWGGKYQCQEISAKGGTNVNELLEKVLLEAELLELQADPKKHSTGAVLEASLDKGKGIVTNLLVQKGSLNVGDTVIAGPNWGRIRAMLDERGNKLNEAGPSKPVQVLGFDGAPQAGEKFYELESEHDAKEIATERQQLIREQGIRATKHITLDEIGRRLAIGNFQQLDLIIKGDVDGSVEALSDSLQKLSNEEVQVRVIHKGVGQITESDVLLASASDAIIIGFQVRPSSPARRTAKQEQIDIRLYSVIYNAIDEVKSAMEGMLAPKIEENVTGTVEVRDVFKVSKVGTVAGCKVTDGRIKKDSNVRLIRDGVVIYTGEIESLKRYREDTKEVKTGYECGIKIKNYNDIKEGDYIEPFEQVEVKRSL